ncbi:MAG TPA: DUF1080 domain-containing protein [Bryobacteraceae bacterium]|nr:DUF1080 domain-containing protein [Bryobacterales bacterium]HRJ17795.1 DUF1080 domain-containing protein [Bryobacteraceae bacterium]
MKRIATLTMILAAATTAVCAQAPKPVPCPDPPGYRDTPQIPGQPWKVHDIDRPRPERVKGSVVATPPPSDAIVLFDGKGLDRWTSFRRGEELAPQWKVENGTLTVAGRGDLVTKEQFGDIQLHLEWKPGIAKCGQNRGNSGVILMGRYEIQVLESYNNETYADGQAASMYGQFPPLKNATNPEEEWNSYDILFKAPKFEGGKMVSPPVVTVIHNGVAVHHGQAFVGQMAHRIHKPFEAHGPEAPLVLQNHNEATSFRNIWVRRVGSYD